MRIGFTIVLFFLFVNTHSQVVEQWRHDNSISNPTVASTDIVYDGINTYVTIQNFNSISSAYLQKFDWVGDLVRTDTINYSYNGCDNRMVRDNDGNIYVCGQKDSGLASSKVKIAKFDSLLNPLWTISAIDSSSFDFFSPRICYSSVENKIYVICQRSGTSAYYSAILKFDLGGNLLWVNDSISSLGLNCIRFGMDTHGNIILGGFNDVPGFDEDFTLIKIDTTGAIAWSRTINNPLDDRVEELATDNQDNIYAFGYFSDANRSRVVKYDSNGNLQWMSGINNFYGSRITTNTSGVYVSGNDSITNKIVVYKLDPSGNITGSGMVSNTGNGILSLKLNSHSELYVCYSTDSATDYRWAVSKFDSTANELWTFKYPSVTPVFSYPTSICLVEDGFIASGLISPDISVARFNDILQTSIEENNFLSVNYWPNPATNSINFSLKTVGNNSILFKIFDVQNRCVFENKFITQNENNFSVDLPAINGGLYFFTLSVSGNVHTGKLIIR